jgi:hypothetical protein
VCHQSVGLIAREIEARGIPTLCMTSALSITERLNPPRAAFLDYPLGHTAGKPHDPPLQRAILRTALRAFETLRAPGVVKLPFEWAEHDDWKDGVMRPKTSGGAHEDDRVPRRPTPQYQTEDDRLRAEAEFARGGCATCVWLEG